jgi:UDP-N-acetylmuramate--alanine ligase
MKLPRDIGPIHFVGIGGIGMSGIAEVLINLGYTVQGSDASDSANVKRLRDKGAKISVGHSAAALGDAEVVVVSTAIKRDNPELTAARAQRLPVVRRAEMLAELMRLKRCVVDPEHLDHFKTFEAVQEAFRAFVENVPFYGFAVMCTDHPVVQVLVGQITDRRVITYGENPQADVRLVDLDHADGQSRFSIVFRDRAGETMHEINGLSLPMPGRHNALNATAAIAVARELGISDDMIRKALQNFGGVRRRFTRTGEWKGVPIIDDYGHHPVEIAAVLRAARESSKGQVIAVVQPHRYSRLASLFEQFSTCFNDADTVIVAHVYAAGEAPIAGADRDSLVQGLRAHGHRQVIPLDGPQDLARMVARLARPGDIVVCLGAGNITQWAYALPGELAALGAVA